MCVRLAETVQTYAIPDLTVLHYVPDSVTPPTLYVADITIDYDQTFRGDPATTVICRVLTSRAHDESGQRLLRKFMNAAGTQSVKAALESGRGAPGEFALDGACDDYHVRRMQGHRLYTVGEKVYIGAEWVVYVIGDGGG